MWIFLSRCGARKASRWCAAIKVHTPRQDWRHGCVSSVSDVSAVSYTITPCGSNTMPIYPVMFVDILYKCVCSEAILLDQTSSQYSSLVSLKWSPSNIGRGTHDPKNRKQREVTNESKWYHLGWSLVGWSCGWSLKISPLKSCLL